MSETRSVDALLTKVESDQLEAKPVETKHVETKSDDYVGGNESDDTNEDTDGYEADSDDSSGSDSSGDSSDLSDKREGSSSPTDSDASESVDDYGNPISKPRMYTEDEVNRMMRERFSRGHLSKEQQQHVQQEQRDNFKFDENSGDSWEIQLEKFVERTVNNISTKKQEEQWRQQEIEKQHMFEEKFNSGMTKYGDFKDVVGSKPITNAMLMATRELENPAAFIYAASKQHPQELERISKLDQYSQMVEIGRLEERMRKAKTVTKAAKPVVPVKGDMPNARDNSRLSIDDKLRQAEKREMSRRARR